MTNNQPVQNQPPSPLQLSRKHSAAAAAKEVIQLDQHCFELTRKGQTKSTAAGNNKRQRSVRKIVEVVLDESNNREQQVAIGTQICNVEQKFEVILCKCWLVLFLIHHLLLINIWGKH